jgi:hypothetical protein
MGEKGTEIWGDLNALRNQRSASRYRDMGEKGTEIWERNTVVDSI